MSLKTIAQAKNLAAKGRHGDTMLVHMTPGEVAGLQTLAQAHGSSLSINPNTGMPEAFNLRKILPTVVGTAVGVATGNPWLGAAVAGGLGYAESGSLMGGLTSAAGAYGGTGLVSGVSAAGTAANLAAPAAASGASGAASAVPGSFAATLPELGVSQAGLTTPTAAFTPIPGNVTAAGAGTGGNLLAAAGPQPGMFDTLTGGIKALGTEAGREAFMTGVGGTSGLISKAGLAAAPIMAASVPEFQQPKIPVQQTMIRPYEYVMTNTSGQPQYSVGDTSERMQLSGVYRPLEPYKASEAYKRKVPFADGGAVAFDGGGLASLLKRRKSLEGDEPYKFSKNRRDTSMKASVEQNFAEGGETDVQATVSPEGIPVSPGAARTLQNVSMVQRLAGIPAIDVSNLPVQQGPQAPVGMVPQGLPSTIEQLYEVYRPSEEDSEDFTTPEEDGGKGGMFGGGTVIGYTSTGQPIYKDKPELHPFFRMVPFGGGYAQGGDVVNPMAYAKGRFLQGPGDGTSDSIPATIAGKQPARLADGEFVIDARTVSEIGNGSSKAGAQKLYAMMDRVHNARKKAKRGQDSKAERYMPA